MWHGHGASGAGGSRGLCLPRVRLRCRNAQVACAAKLKFGAFSGWCPRVWLLTAGWFATGRNQEGPTYPCSVGRRCTASYVRSNVGPRSSGAVLRMQPAGMPQVWRCVCPSACVYLCVRMQCVYGHGLLLVYSECSVNKSTLAGLVRAMLFGVRLCCTGHYRCNGQRALSMAWVLHFHDRPEVMAGRKTATACDGRGDVWCYVLPHSRDHDHGEFVCTSSWDLLLKQQVDEHNWACGR